MILKLVVLNTYSGRRNKRDPDFVAYLGTEPLRLMLASGITISLVGISIQIMRLIGAVVGNVQDLRRSVQNIGKVSDFLLEDYLEIRKVLRRLINFVSNLQDNLFGPLKTVSGLISRFGGGEKQSRKQDSDTTPPAE